MVDAEYFPVSKGFVFNYYHPYGNTPPEDLLQSITTDTSQPDILLLGCGDLRSCLYTLWNNFDRRHSQNFKGVHFVLNDISAGVLARNIIFLYMCTQMPASYDDQVKWVASFWAIWYCHELLPQHKEVLMDALSNLLRWSTSTKSWTESDDNPLRLLVQFASKASHSQIYKAWEKWYNDILTVTEMRSKRSERFQSTGTESLHNPVRHLLDYYGGILLKNFSKSERKSLKDDVKYYFKNGFVFAEEVLGGHHDEPTSANSTFIERSDKMYNLPLDFIPYRSFFFTYRFSSSNLKKYVSYSDIPLMVEDEKFTHKPLLANSVQQFSIWIRSCAEVFSQSHNNIMFTFQSSDALEFCQKLHNEPSNGIPHSFDAIYSSNLLDYFAPPSFVLLSLQILKPDGVLFTSIMFGTSVSNTFAEYIQKGFGLECKQLPLMCGMRCVSYENEFSDAFPVKPVPHSLGMDTALGVGVKSLLWQRVTATPLTQPSEEHLALLWKMLSSSIVQLLMHDSTVHNNYSCVGSVIILLQSFASQFDSAIHGCSNYQFWKPLCSLLLQQKHLRAFLTSVQTQALLHNVHLHLTLSESECPLCNKQQLSNAVIHQSITVPIKPTDSFAKGDGGNFTIIIYTNAFSKQTYQWNYFDPNCISGVHVLDTFAANIKDHSLFVSFYIPVTFSQNGYSMALLFNNTLIYDGEINGSGAVCKSYYFNKLIQQLVCQPSSSSLGTIIQHSGDDSLFETVIALNDLSSFALCNNQSHLITQKCNGRTIRIAIGDYYIDISYPYTIEYGERLSIKLSRKSKKIMVKAIRVRLSLHEKPVFFVNPNNTLALPVMPLSDTDAHSFCELSSWRDLYRPLPDTYRSLKATFAALFETKTVRYFTLYCKCGLLPQVKYMVAVLNRVFDIYSKTPAIDALFFDCSEQDHPIIRQWRTIWIKFDSDDEYQLAKQMFTYFSKCTVTTRPVPKENSTYKYLVDQKVDHLFSHRAVIYPLYPNGDERTADKLFSHYVQTFLYSDHDSKLPGPKLPHWHLRFKAIFHEDQCSNCRCKSDHLRTCSRCQMVQYCNHKCQKEHWETHKQNCKPYSK